MRYVFVLENDVLGVIFGKDNLANEVLKAYKIVSENNIEDKLVIHEFKDGNTLDTVLLHPTYRICTYDKAGSICLGLRLDGLGGKIDIPLDVKIK